MFVKQKDPPSPMTCNLSKNIFVGANINKQHMHGLLSRYHHYDGSLKAISIKHVNHLYFASYKMDISLTSIELDFCSETFPFIMICWKSIKTKHLLSNYCRMATDTNPFFVYLGMVQIWNWLAVCVLWLLPTYIHIPICSEPPKGSDY
jgi:hypothetical protein